jgi:hypothetical protein
MSVCMTMINDKVWVYRRIGLCQISESIVTWQCAWKCECRRTVWWSVSSLTKLRVMDQCWSSEALITRQCAGQCGCRYIESKLGSSDRMAMSKIMGMFVNGVMDQCRAHRKHWTHDNVQGHENVNMTMCMTMWISVNIVTDQCRVSETFIYDNGHDKVKVVKQSYGAVSNLGSTSRMTMSMTMWMSVNSCHGPVSSMYQCWT